MRVLPAILAFCLVASPALPAGLEMRDSVSAPGAQVSIGVRSTGMFMGRGGVLIELTVDGRSLGRRLSGGDGWAYWQYLPKRKGLIGFSARAGNDAANGRLLVLAKGTEIVFVEVGEGLIKQYFKLRPYPGAAAGIERIALKYPVIYIKTPPASLLDLDKWIKRHNMPEAPLLDWQDNGVLKQLTGKGFKIKAVIGGPEVLEAAREYGGLLMSLSPGGDFRHPKDWAEIEEIILNNDNNVK